MIRQRGGGNLECLPIHHGAQQWKVGLDALYLPAAIKADLLEGVTGGMSVPLFDDGGGDRIILNREGGELKARKLVTWNRRSGGTEARFEFRQESDGSWRLVDLLPAFLDLALQDSDRSLHTQLTRRFAGRHPPIGGGNRALTSVHRVNEHSQSLTNGLYPVRRITTCSQS